MKLSRSNLVLSVYFPKTNKFMNINSVNGATLLSELGLTPGSEIHVQDKASVSKHATSATENNKVKQDISDFVRKDFSASRSARASFMQMSSGSDTALDSDKDFELGTQSQNQPESLSVLSKTFLEESVSKIDVILEKFIQHHQLFEFIELFRIYMKEELTIKLRQDPDSADQLPLIPGKGKNFMHLAVEHNAVQILSYMVIELNLDAN